MMDIVPIGTKTEFGVVKSIGFKEGERYYMMIDDDETVSLMPYDIIEKQ